MSRGDAITILHHLILRCPLLIHLTIVTEFTERHIVKIHCIVIWMSTVIT